MATKSECAERVEESRSTPETEASAAHDQSLKRKYNVTGESDDGSRVSNIGEGSDAHGNSPGKKKSSSSSPSTAGEKKRAKAEKGQHPETASHDKVIVLEAFPETFGPRASARDASKGASEATSGRGQEAKNPVPAVREVDRFSLARESLVFATECHLAVLQDEDGDTPLHLAVVQAHKHLVHHLVYLVSRSSRKVDIANKLRQTPLHLAVITNQADLVRLLLANNASVNMPDRLGRTGLHLAAERNYGECAAALLEAREVQLEVRNFEGFTPVHVCVFHNSFTVLRLLLQAGALITPRDGKSGRTPLHHAAESGSGAMVQFLLAHGADVDATTYAGNTALHAAAGRGHEHIVSLLVTAGADPRVQNTEGDVAADMAKNRTVKVGGSHR